jgi:transmembrane sensor
MSKLRAPLRLELDDPPSEQEVRRIWAGVQRRRVRRQARVELRTPLGMAAAAAVCVVSLLLLLSRFLASTPNAAALTAGGQPLGQLVAAPRGAVDLSDGSRIELGPNARLEVLDNSARAFGTALRAGRALFDVRPGGPRRWTIEAGLASVEVVGTRFTVSRSPHAVDVSVERGVVVVRGDNVPDKVRRLTAGETLTVHEPESASGLPEPASARETVVLEGPPSGKASAPQPASASTVKPPGFDELIAAADAQRRRGDFRGAEASLKSLLASAPDGKRGALAAFTLGKLELDNLGDPQRAAAAFARAVSLGPPAAIAEDALARLVEAEGRAGQLERARADARAYQKRYPNGRRSYAVGRWLEQP